MFHTKADVPSAVFLAPTVLLPRASNHTAVLAIPVVFSSRAPTQNPIDVGDAGKCHFTTLYPYIERAPLISRILRGLGVLVPIPTRVPVKAPLIPAIEPSTIVFPVVASACAPMAVAFVIAPFEAVARYHTKVFPVPVVTHEYEALVFFPAKYQRAVFPLPVVFAESEEAHTAVFQEPLILLNKTPCHTPVFPLQTVLFMRAPSPFAVFDHPVVFAESEETHTAVFQSPVVLSANE